MKCTYACNTPEHAIARRAFLGGLGMGALGVAASSTLGALVQPAVAAEMAKQQKHVLCIFMAGGLSQLESWDPKPLTDTGGPFRAIPTSVTGVHISELLPHTAKQMHRMALVRSVNTKEDDHGKGAVCMQTGRRPIPGSEYPHLGAVSARLLTDDINPLPGFIRIAPSGSSVTRKDAAYLGAKYGSVSLGGGAAPQNSDRPQGLSAEGDSHRNDFRRGANDRFAGKRRTAETEAYMQSYEQAARLMEQREVFDVSKEPQAELDRYGTHDFGRHCLMARRLIEHGATFVQVSHSNYDTHFENFDFHIEQLGEFDRTFANLLDDLAARGLLDHTLVVVMSEFGRTPRINQNYGRDHWGHAWSVALAGCGLQHGAVIGKTNENGTKVADREVDHGHLFHTYVKALGMDPTGNFDIGGRQMPIADPARSAISEMLA
ncbi:MAG: DUF1501 domain-containing protein [Planctomycetia bacterium]|nr:DUF1501 domain-containing protein [Planctomycetia bacterium]